MTVDRIVRLVAGALVLATLALSVTVSRSWLYVTAFVGLNLLQSALPTGVP